MRKKNFTRCQVFEMPPAIFHPLCVDQEIVLTLTLATLTSFSFPFFLHLFAFPKGQKVLALLVPLTVLLFLATRFGKTISLFLRICVQEGSGRRYCILYSVSVKQMKTQKLATTVCPSLVIIIIIISIIIIVFVLGASPEPRRKNDFHIHIRRHIAGD